MGRVISLHRGCLGDVSSGRVVGVSTWCITHGRHTRVNTSVGTLYVFWFLILNLYVLWFQKPMYIMKEHWWFLTLSWLDDDQGTFLTAHDVFVIWMENPQFWHSWFFKTEIDLYNCFIHSLLWFHVKFLYIYPPLSI